MQYMIIHECLKTFDKNIKPLAFSPLSIINQHVFWKYFLTQIKYFSLFSLTKYTNSNIFFTFVNISNFDGRFHIFKINFSWKFLSTFLVFAGLWSDQTLFKAFSVIYLEDNEKVKEGTRITVLTPNY